MQRLLGDGIEIRLMQETDVEEMFAVIDRNRTHLRRWLPWVDRTISTGPVRDFVRDALAKYQAGREMHLLVRVDGAIAGAVGHHAVDASNRSVSLGYWLAEGYQGRGIITRCTSALIGYLFEERHLHRIEIRCGTGNERSAAIPRRLGFTREGVIRHGQCLNGEFIDLELWGLLENEWHSR